MSSKFAGTSGCQEAKGDIRNGMNNGPYRREKICIFNDSTSERSSNSLQMLIINSCDDNTTTTPHLIYDNYV